MFVLPRMENEIAGCHQNQAFDSLQAMRNFPEIYGDYWSQRKMDINIGSCESECRRSEMEDDGDPGSGGKFTASDSSIDRSSEVNGSDISSGQMREWLNGSRNDNDINKETNINQFIRDDVSRNVSRMQYLSTRKTDKRNKKSKCEECVDVKVNQGPTEIDLESFLKHHLSSMEPLVSELSQVSEPSPAHQPLSHSSPTHQPLSTNFPQPPFQQPLPQSSLSGNSHVFSSTDIPFYGNKLHDTNQTSVISPPFETNQTTATNL